MFRVSLTNFRTWFKDPVVSLEEAIALGKTSGFEFLVYRQAENDDLLLVGSYAIFSGYSNLGEE